MASTGQLTVRLRPLRLAFLVNPHDVAAIRRAIQINSVLWGGVFNPIIPVYKKALSAWERKPSPPPAAREMVRGHVEAFDPDYLVRVGEVAGPMPDFPKRRAIGADEIVDRMAEDGTPGFGVGLTELADYLYQTEFRFERRDPLRVVRPDTASPLSLLKAACFGECPQEGELHFNRAFYEQLNAVRCPVDANGFYDLFARTCAHPLRLLGWGLTPSDARRGPYERVLFYLDAEAPSEVLDYWNLRAAGCWVRPIPRQWADALREPVRRIVGENYVPNPFNPEIMEGTTLLKGRRIDEDEVREFHSSLDLPNEHRNPSLVLQSWYPRLHSRWARENAGEGPSFTFAEDREQALSPLGPTVRFRELAPRFVRSYRGSRRAGWANVVNIRAYGPDVELAQVIPPSEHDLAPDLARFSLRDRYRVSVEGPTIICTRPGVDHDWPLPSGEDVFLAWLQREGWDAALSPAGRIAKQLVNSLGGMYGVYSLASREVFSLLPGLRREAGLRVGQTLHRLEGETQYGMRTDARRRLAQLLEANALKLGMSVQCPWCGQRSWFGLPEVNYTMNCPKCAQTYDFPTSSPPSDPWRYRVAEPLALPDQAVGAYCVLLTMLFFLGQNGMRGRASTCWSFRARDKMEHSIESDLGRLWESDDSLDRATHVIFAECKTRNDFGPDDYRRMKAIARGFPGATLVFSTLKTELSASEQRAIARIAERGRRHWRDDRQRNPVLVLTDTELFGSLDPWHTWEQLGGRWADFGKLPLRVHTLAGLCDATQQLYLGMQSREDWSKEYWAKRRHRRQARQGKLDKS